MAAPAESDSVRLPELVALVAAQGRWHRAGAAAGRLVSGRVPSQTPVLEAQPVVWWLQTLAARSYSYFRDGNA
jgi:hypothetical protein